MLPHSPPRPARRVFPATLAALVGVLAFLFLTPQLSAQAGGGYGPGGGGGGRQGGGDRGARMQAALFDGIKLTDAEQKSVDSVKTAYESQMEPLRSQGPAARSQMRDLRQRQIADFRSILTSDQQSAFDKNLDAFRSRMRSE